jgi:uncharacterized membrane protein YcaP (DUF421 family)
MDYITIFDPVPWERVGIAVLQTCTLYWLVLIVLKITGRRLFAENKPEDFVILVLIAEACNSGLTHQEGGYWASFFSVITIFVLGALCERITPLRHLIDGKPISLYKDGNLDEKAMAKHVVDETDLEEVARLYGLPSYREFDSITLETGGEITGVLPESMRKWAPENSKPNR